MMMMMMILIESIELRFYATLDTKYNPGHFGDVLPSQSLGFVLNKLNLTQRKQTTREQNGKTVTQNEKSKPKSEENLNQQVSFKNCLYQCTYHCAQLIQNTA